MVKLTHTFESKLVEECMKKGTWKTLLEILLVSTRLGLTSFGGPVAHLGYFHEEYVRKRKWMDERSFAELVALCQFLPGPASSQVGIGIGAARAGVVGGIMAFIGFTFPSVLVLILFALFLQGYEVVDSGWIHGLKVVAVAIVAHAILGMAQSLTPDIQRKSLALFALIGTLIWQTAFTQVVIILFAAFFGYLLYKQHNKVNEAIIQVPISRLVAYICLALFFGLLILLPLLAKLTSLESIAMFDSFYRAGALVFGGGHVVLPLLERALVPTGWISKEAFLAGYGAVQAVPGPLFTFATYLGAVMNGWIGGLLATLAVFLPGFLLIIGTLPFWNSLRNNHKVKGALSGVNAAVVGILIASFYQPIWTSSILKPLDFVLAAMLFSMLAFWKTPPWVVVLTGAFGGFLLTLI
jgi:chromate transporter